MECPIIRHCVCIIHAAFNSAFSPSHAMIQTLSRIRILVRDCGNRALGRYMARLYDIGVFGRWREHGTWLQVQFMSLLAGRRTVIDYLRGLNSVPYTYSPVQ